MDIAGPIAVIIIVIIIFSICGWCCKRKRDGTVYGYGTNVTVTSQPIPQQQPYPVHGGPPPNSYGGTGAYPPSMPMPQPGFSPHGGAPYPPVSGYPPASGYPPGPAPGGTPYPPAAGYPPQPGFQSQPPPYDVAMSQPPVHPPAPQTEAYGKQAPYNPNY